MQNSKPWPGRRSVYCVTTKDERTLMFKHDLAMANPIDPPGWPMFGAARSLESV
jgi:hypothetical protein